MGEVLSYHDNPTAERKWSDMERFNMAKRLNAEALAVFSRHIGAAGEHFGDTSPSELSYGWADGDPA